MNKPIVDGDVVRWRYKDEKPEQLGAWGRYHCRSQIAIADDGWLVDTFWGSRRSDSSAAWPYGEAEEILELTHLGNMAELEKRPEYEAMYYADADCVNLNHSNSSRDNFYIRKGALRCREKMRSVIVERIARIENDISFANDRLERARADLLTLDGGADINKIYL